MAETNRTLVLQDLNSACSSLSMLLICVPEFVPEEEWAAVAAAVRPHLQAAAKALTECSERNAELLALCREQGVSEVVRIELLDLQHHHRGRTSTGPGDPFALSHVSTWRAPAVDTDLDDAADSSTGD